MTKTMVNTVLMFLVSRKDSMSGIVPIVQSHIKSQGCNKSHAFTPMRYPKVNCLVGVDDTAAGLSNLVNTGRLPPIILILAINNTIVRNTKTNIRVKQ